MITAIAIEAYIATLHKVLVVASVSMVLPCIYMKAMDKGRRIVSEVDAEISVLVQSVYFHLRSLVSRVIERSTRYI